MQPKTWIVCNRYGINRGRYYDYHEAVRRAYELNQESDEWWETMEETKYRNKFLKPVEQQVLSRQFKFVNNGGRFL